MSPRKTLSRRQKEDIVADASGIFDTKRAQTFENIVDAGTVDGKLVGMPFEVFSDGVNMTTAASAAVTFLTTAVIMHHRQAEALLRP